MAQASAPVLALAPAPALALTLSVAIVKDFKLGEGVLLLAVALAHALEMLA